YSPLGDNSIRLLQIEAVTNPSLNHERAAIRCQIHHFHIAKAPNYRALSYAWGNSATRFIYLNDQRIEVRKNLWQALWHLRNNNFYTKWIWIDALCIDQLNTVERNHQVLLMGRIYKTAAEVFAWLGCLSDLPFGSRRILRYGLHNFVSLFTLQYWQRMWILQEIGLA
ncbi:uncharacterized protein K444DRAFT_488107, partial [Hyaloscypha bicolor E]